MAYGPDKVPPAVGLVIPGIVESVIGPVAQHGGQAIPGMGEYVLSEKIGLP